MAKILLVEDDNNLREIFEMRLQAESHDTTVANDGEEALVVALKEKPDLIIADVMMPKMSGFEMLETLRATPDMADVKVIMMTALGQAEDRSRGEKLGVVKYLVKSQVTLEDFVRTVQEVLGAGSADASAPKPSEQNSNLATKESEKKMDDNAQQNPAPAEPGADSAGGGDTNPVSTPGGDSSGQMSASDAQSAMKDQVDDAMGGDADNGGGDVSMGTPPAGQTDPDQDAGSDEDQAGGNPPTAPGGM